MGETNHDEYQLYSCFKDNRHKSARFHLLVNDVENVEGELTEDDVIQVALVEYKHIYDHDLNMFRHGKF
ncbi:hypothetical protein HanIR_Chr14g0709041 [Helianthus annuus]|nr:hypothetical protein HanIR_Chr14g0709041 [Helianthus annuus]